MQGLDAMTMALRLEILYRCAGCAPRFAFLKKRNPAKEKSPAGFLVLLASETLVVGRGVVAAVRASRRNACDADRHDRNGSGRTCCRTPARRAGSRSPSLRHRATRQRHQKSHCEELFHETPQEKPHV
jgi:hypothetical protein